MRTYDLDNIFSIAEVDDNQVIIKVHADSPLKVAQYPFISGDNEYITVIRGTDRDRRIKVIKKDGSSFDFDHHTPIGDDLKELQQQVELFIEQNYIALDYCGEHFTEAGIIYDDDYNSWELILYTANHAHYRSHIASSVEDMIKEAEKFGVIAEKWEKSESNDGKDLWIAVNPKFSIK